MLLERGELRGPEHADVSCPMAAIMSTIPR